MPGERRCTRVTCGLHATMGDDFGRSLQSGTPWPRFPGERRAAHPSAPPTDVTRTLSGPRFRPPAWDRSWATGSRRDNLTCASASPDSWRNISITVAAARRASGATARQRRPNREGRSRQSALYGLSVVSGVVQLFTRTELSGATHVEGTMDGDAGASSAVPRAAWSVCNPGTAEECLCHTRMESL